MKEKMGKIIYKVIVLGMVICSISLLIAKVIPMSEENVWNNEEIVEENVNNIEEENKKEEDKKGPFQVGEEFTFGPYTYRVNSATVTKEKGNFPAPTDWIERYPIDESGNLVGENSYVIVNLTMVNNRKEVLELYLNTMSLGVLNDPVTNVSDYCECISSSKLDGYDSKDYFKVELEPSVEYTYDLVFATSDKSLKNNKGYLKIRRQKATTRKEDEDKQRIVYINFK